MGTKCGFVRRDEAYTTGEINKRLGVGEISLRVACKNGLKRRQFGKQFMILGGDLIDYLASRDGGSK